MKSFRDLLQPNQWPVRRSGREAGGNVRIRIRVLMGLLLVCASLASAQEIGGSLYATHTLRYPPDRDKSESV